MTCTTHHYACPCREAEFEKAKAEVERLRAENAEMRDVVTTAEHISWEDTADGRFYLVGVHAGDRLIAALAGLRAREGK